MAKGLEKVITQGIINEQQADITTIKAMLDQFNSMKVNLKGFIGIPSVNGFDIYEYDADKLKALVRLLSQDFKIKEKEEQQ